MNIEKPLADEQMVQQINEYLPIVLYLSKKFNYTAEAKHFRDSLEAQTQKNIVPEIEHLLDNVAFLEVLLDKILKFEEGRIYQELIIDVKNLNILLTRRIMALFEIDHRYEYLLDFFNGYEKFLLDKQRATSTTGKLKSVSQN